MKSTGMIRQIDDLGRVVIPKEIRRTMRLRDGDLLEILVNEGDEIVFKKYSPVSKIPAIMQAYAEVLFQNTNRSILITDCDRIIAHAGFSVKKEDLSRLVNRSLEALIGYGVGFIAASDSERLYPVDGLEHEAAVVCPIIIKKTIVGYVIMLMSENGDMPTQTEFMLAQVAASFLAGQMEA